jgi:hypothetical protein
MQPAGDLCLWLLVMLAVVALLLCLLRVSVPLLPLLSAMMLPLLLLQLLPLPQRRLLPAAERRFFQHRRSAVAECHCF